ncbi:Triple gene block protein 3 [Nerine virus X]|uniref:Movement protein TGBp3 n=1 Tax=Nerine virus X TaxID=333348 RepID=Q2V0R7_9VIRU|nr:Triple gene block protein 3 [Nerine virus X]BAE66618.1 Triple gene block protein 3 [Nerine virus X]
MEAATGTEPSLSPIARHNAIYHRLTAPVTASSPQHSPSYSQRQFILALSVSIAALILTLAVIASQTPPPCVVHLDGNSAHIENCSNQPELPELVNAASNHVRGLIKPELEIEPHCSYGKH